MEALFQILANDAIRSFKDSSEINSNFALLSQGVRYEAYLWNKFYSHLQNVPNNGNARRPSSTFSSTGTSNNCITDSACNSASDTHTISRSNSPSDSSTSDSGCEGHSSLRRCSVKDRRRMFEQQQQPCEQQSIITTTSTKYGKNIKVSSVTSTSIGTRDAPRSALKRTVSLKDRRRFWESLAAKASKDHADESTVPVKQSLHNSNVIKCPRKTRTIDEPTEDSKRTRNITPPPDTSSSSQPCQVNNTQSSQITTSCNVSAVNGDVNCLTTSTSSQIEPTSNNQENAPSPVPETQGNLDKCQLTSSKQDLIFTSSAAQSTDLNCDTGSWVEVQTEPTYSRVSGFIDDEIGEYGSFMGGSPHVHQESNRPPGSPVFQPSNQLGKLFGVEPSRVTVHGQGLKEGFVNKDITFRVYTGDAGPGFLTVGIQERSPGTLKKVHLQQIDSDDNKKGLWEATYQVSQPGYYVIFVRWSDCNIVGSPFVAQITNPAAIF